MTSLDLSTDVLNRIAQETKTHLSQVQSVLSLLNQGATIPFIARYRKEKTKGLNEVELRDIETQIHTYTQLEHRRQAILKKLTQDRTLNEALKKALNQATTLSLLEELYAPFKSKRKTKADQARQAGLEPIAQCIRRGRPWSSRP